MTIPESLRAYLADESLAPLWTAVRRHLERNGVLAEGTVGVELTGEAANQLSGLLGRTVQSGSRRLSLAELDTALRSSAAEASLATVVAALTGPLRDHQSERATVDAEWAGIWTDLDRALFEVGLLEESWVAPWVSWLRGGVCRRSGADATRQALPRAAAVLGHLTRSESVTAGQIPLGTLAARFTGNAHGLDAETLASTLVLGGLTLSGNEPPTSSAGERRQVWTAAGVATDQVSGTVITWELRPPGDDPWSRMMRDRAKLKLVTHLTALELQHLRLSITGPVFGTENPQVLQAAAERRVPVPVVCFAGQPSLAGALLLERIGPALRYHGDFDWPGIAIAARIFAAGAVAWRFSARDYLDAAERAAVPLPLNGTVQPTPWDLDLQPSMQHRAVAVHEEAVIDFLLADLQSGI